MKIVSVISRGRRRILPLYIAGILLFLLFSQIDHFERYQQTPGVVLKRILAYQRPIRSKHSRFPKKIWQTWKVDPLEFESRDSDRARTWPKLNPGHRYEVLTDSNDLDYVETHFGPDGENRPDIVETYRTLNATIIKADLLRYLVMYIEGGVYADIDVEAIRPINTWIPPEFSEDEVDLVISVEIDEPTFVNHTILGPKSQSFCQWTFMCKPRLPVMMRLIEHVMHWLNEVAQRQMVPVSEIMLNFDEVITGTGPSALTAAMLTEMESQTHQRLHWDTFHNLSEPILVGNILVLTVEAFAAGQGHSNSGSHESEKALIKHHYHASKWPSRHPRYSHPAYGMVEECNWARDCVLQWTENTGVFDSLPEERKQELIAEKEVADKERFDKEEAEKQEAEKEEADKKFAEVRASCESAGLIPASPTESQSPAEATQTGATETQAQATETPQADAEGNSETPQADTEAKPEQNPPTEK